MTAVRNRKTIADQNLLKQATRISELLDKTGDLEHQKQILLTVATSKGIELLAA